MLRTFEQDLVAWKQQPEHLPLLVRGARQIGKSYTIERFGKQHFDDVVVVNFEFRPELKTCFIQLEPSEIIKQLSLYTGQPIIPGETLLFLDEIQECPQAILALRYFKELLPALHVIGAGSLLEFVLNQPHFRMPVGRVQFLFVKPMTFREFLSATSSSHLSEFLATVTLKDTIPEIIHRQLLRLLHEYMIIGGMPAVVQNYLNQQDYLQTQDYQNTLLLGYRNDFGKYAKHASIPYIQELFAKAPGLIAQQFKYSDVNPDMSSRELKPALQSLVDAGLIYKIYATAATGLPLISTANKKKFKLFFLDVGLVNRSTHVDIKLLLQEDLLLINRGALAEQLVAQELLAYQNRHQLSELYFWAREKYSSRAEVDFVTTTDSQIIPIEVKAGSTGQLKSLRMLMQEQKLPLGIRVSQKPLAFRDNILSIPLYMVSEISRLVEVNFH